MMLFARRMAASRSSLPIVSRGMAGVPLTKIVATIGPVSEDAETLPKVTQAGMQVMRLNFSHATDEEVVLRLSSLSNTTGMFPLDGASGMLRTVLLDTKGPEIRTGNLQAVKDSGDVKAKIQVKTGAEMLLTNDPAFKECSDASTMFVTYATLEKTCTVGKTVLLDDGAIALTVKDVSSKGVLCSVENDGEIASRRGVNLPGMAVDLPAMSDLDKEHIRYGVEKDVDFVAASFVRKASDVEEIRAHVATCHAEFWPLSRPQAKIIAKVESTEALENLDEITDASDGIMVARGDLGVEVPLEEVVIWQKEMVQRCEASGKPVIVATQMLESMQKNPRPTRAEVSDVTNAVLDGADAVMLSGESANGKFPVESVAMMNKIIAKTEEWMPTIANLDAMVDQAESKEDATAASAVFTSEKLGAGCIVLNGDVTGDVARLVSKYRPSAPVLLLLDGAEHADKVARQTSLHRGVFPTLLPKQEALAAAKEQGLFSAGDDLVTITVGASGGGIDMGIEKAA
mmetsp:Transcript_60566/g.118742  ORF Transcript_60566/g.118742 Transcript_60566/m.118742 type:complete len:514 (+) Transcript_60566:50-1591(+)